MKAFTNAHSTSPLRRHSLGGAISPSRLRIGMYSIYMSATLLFIFTHRRTDVFCLNKRKWSKKKTCISVDAFSYREVSVREREREVMTCTYVLSTENIS